MSKPNVSNGELITKSVHTSVDLFDNKALSDVEIKLGDGQRIFGHKRILAQKSKWFFRVFNGNFPVC
jgi:hypothetical protein